MIVPLLFFTWPMAMTVHAGAVLREVEEHRRWKAQADEHMARQQREYDILILEHMWRQLE